MDVDTSPDPPSSSSSSSMDKDNKKEAGDSTSVSGQVSAVPATAEVKGPGQDAPGVDDEKSESQGRQQQQLKQNEGNVQVSGGVLVGYLWGGDGVEGGAGKEDNRKIEGSVRQDEDAMVVETSGALSDGKVGVAEAAGASEGLLTSAVSRTLRRGYLAQSLARIVGAAGVIREARRAGCWEGGEGKENMENGAGLQGATEAVGNGAVSGGVQAEGGEEREEVKGGKWAVAQEQSSAAVEALDALDRGMEELLTEVCVETYTVAYDTGFFSSYIRIHTSYIYHLLRGDVP